MARTLGRLSAVKVQGTKQPGYYADGGNLYLRIADRRFEGLDLPLRDARPDARHGPRRISSIGLAKARELAGDVAAWSPSGSTLSRREARSARLPPEAAKSMTFDGCAKAYIAAHEAGMAERQASAAMANTLATYASPGVWPAAGCSGRHRARAQGGRAHLVQEARDGIARARPHRGRARLGQGARLSRR